MFRYPFQYALRLLLLGTWTIVATVLAQVPPAAVRTANAQAKAPESRIWLQDVVAKSGIQFHLRNSISPQRYSVETMLGGVAVFDYDNDGLLDIFFTNGAAIPSLEKIGPEYWNRLYRNNGDGTFTDVTEKAGLQGVGYSMGVAAGDYDNDGFVDLYVAGVNRNQLLRNNGDGTFTDVTERAGVAGSIPGYGKPWAVAACRFLPSAQIGAGTSFLSGCDPVTS